MADGRFRRDLFFRLSVFPILLPPLRERPEDITELAGHFLQLAARRYGKPAPRLTLAAGRELEAYDWPGTFVNFNTSSSAQSCCRVAKRCASTAF